MHRNTYLIVSILAVVAALVIGVNVGKKLQNSPSASPSPTTTVAPTPTDTIQTYVDSMCGFSVQYPSVFSLMDNASGSAVLSFSGDQTKSIVMTCQKNIPRPALPADKIVAMSLPTTTGASVSAKLYHDNSNKDGSAIDALIFTHPTSKMDVFISGVGDAYTNLLSTIQIIP